MAGRYSGGALWGSDSLGKYGDRDGHRDYSDGRMLGGGVYRHRGGNPAVAGTAGEEERGGKAAGGAGRSSGDGRDRRDRGGDGRRRGSHRRDGYRRGGRRCAGRGRTSYGGYESAGD